MYNETVFYTLDTFFRDLLPVIAGFSLLEIAAALLLAFCVYYDARSLRNRLAVMWGLLCGFFGVIPAIVYLIIRSNQNSKPMACGYCGQWMPYKSMQCPACGQPVLENGFPVNPQMLDVYRRRSKGLLIAWICVYALALILAVAFICTFVPRMMSMMGELLSYEGSTVYF